MNKFYNETLNKLEAKIKELEIETDYPIQQLESIISIIIQCLSEAKKHVLKHGFKNIEEEIHFFKYQKPAVVSKLIYYNAIYKIEAKRPFGGKQIIEGYLNKELLELKRFYDRNIGFYKYYKTDSTYLDHKYFVRGKHDIKLGLDTVYFETDHRFSTSHDYKVAKIIANKLIQKYIEEQLYNLSIKGKIIDQPTLNWTSSKSALIELIYALHSYGVFDNGNSDIRLIARYFETAFNIHLGDFYHTYMELKARKINRTKFLDGLRESLIRKMEEQDDR